jgi:hypothetical protein
MGFVARHFAFGSVSQKRWITSVADGFSRRKQIRRMCEQHDYLLGPIFAALVVVSAITMEPQSANAQSAPGGISEARSLEKCEFPDPVGNKLVPIENRGVSDQTKCWQSFQRGCNSASSD